MSHARLQPGVAYVSDSEELDPGDALGCGGHSKKTLTDAAAALVDFDPSDSSVAALRARNPSLSGPRRPRSATELTTYRVTARLVYAKLEADRDVHLVIQDPATLGTMIVEFPDPTCPVVVGTPHAAEIAAARRAVLQAIGSGFAPRLFGTAEITGVGFFDLVHGQHGVAPNGIELHPVLSFRLLTQPSLGIRSWHGQKQGPWLAEHATIRLCALRMGRYRAIISDHTRAGGTHTFRRTIVQASRCSTSTLSWQVPASPRVRLHDLTLSVTVASANHLESSQTKPLP